MYYVYLLLLKNKRIYHGFTSDLRRRQLEHINGQVKSTCNLRPLKLIYYEVYLLKKDAQAREKYLKTGDGRKDIKKQMFNLFKTLEKQ